ncbi:hypothetical protein AG4045_016313 [Apium graveolens]|uniref:EDS1 EP domain-containing protein n=1 Tax=Apium graveolens TaxID=4045 RepID=A0A6L5B7B1_APIGR|nr:hypothetical protein AG4045_016313 [Apium graveolens]
MKCRVLQSLQRTEGLLSQRRSEHYVLLEKWLQVEEPSSRRRKNACSFNEDSCFWAHVEEALISLELLKDEEICPVVEADVYKKMEKFEEYVMESIAKLMVDPEIFLEGSSFRTWWSMYSSKKGSTYQCPLANYMKNESSRAYA